MILKLQLDRFIYLFYLQLKVPPSQKSGRFENPQL